MRRLLAEIRDMGGPARGLYISGFKLGVILAAALFSTALLIKALLS